MIHHSFDDFKLKLALQSDESNEMSLIDEMFLIQNQYLSLKCFIGNKNAFK